MLEPQGTLFGLLFWHLTNPEHFREDRKCFLCTFSPGPGKGKKLNVFPLCLTGKQSLNPMSSQKKL